MRQVRVIETRALRARRRQRGAQINREPRNVGRRENGHVEGNQRRHRNPPNPHASIRGMARARALLPFLLWLALAADAAAQGPVTYRLSFPEREHRLMQVELTIPDLPSGLVELRMSRTSPGRYALHEFAKNVFDVRVTDGAGRALTATQPNLHQWNVTGHDGTVQVRYRVFGDRLDGTYLAVDSTHAHINM